MEVLIPGGLRELLSDAENCGGKRVGGVRAETCGEEDMAKDSMGFHYCQGTVLDAYHSNVRRGSGVDGRGWREFGGLVRRCGDA